MIKKVNNGGTAVMQEKAMEVTCSRQPASEAIKGRTRNKDMINSQRGETMRAKRSRGTRKKVGVGEMSVANTKASDNSVKFPNRTV